MDLIVVQTTSESSREQLQRVLEVAQELGVPLEPQHPGVEDPELSRFLAGPVADRAGGERAAERLRALDGVDAAYIQPTPTLP
jgi:hypothetical protein